MRKRNREEDDILKTALLEVERLKAQLLDAAIWEILVKESYKILCADGVDDAGHVEAFRKVFEDVVANDLPPDAALRELSDPVVLSTRLQKAYGIILDEAAQGKGQEYQHLKDEVTRLHTGIIEARKESRKLQCKNLVLQRKNKKLLNEVKTAGAAAKRRNYILFFAGVAASITIGGMWHYNIFDKNINRVAETFSSWNKSAQVEKKGDQQQWQMNYSDPESVITNKADNPVDAITQAAPPAFHRLEQGNKPGGATL